MNNLFDHRTYTLEGGWEAPGDAAIRDYERQVQHTHYGDGLTRMTDEELAVPQAERQAGWRLENYGCCFPSRAEFEYEQIKHLNKWELEERQRAKERFDREGCCYPEISHELWDKRWWAGRDARIAADRARGLTYMDPVAHAEVRGAKRNAPLVLPWSNTQAQTRHE